MNRLLTAVLFACALIPAGCRSATEKHYAIHGEVISVDAPGSMMEVKHGDIPGLMPGMTMSYMVAEPKQIEKLQPGDKITADLVVSENKGRLEKIVLVEKAPPATPAAEPAKAQ